jgi:integrase
VFCHPHTGHYYDASKIRERFKTALKCTEVRNVRFHYLRHTFGTRMASAGAPLRAIQEWMGHAQYTTIEIYADYAPDPSQGGAWGNPRVLDPTRQDPPRVGLLV